MANESAARRGRFSSRAIPKSSLPDLPLHGVVQALALVILFFSGLVDLPRTIQVGPVTSQAFLTVGYYCSAIFLIMVTPVLEAPVPWKTVPLAVFMFWAVSSLAWSPARLNGIQNILATGAFPLLMLVGEATASTIPQFAFWLDRWFARSVLLATVLYAASVMLSGPGSNALISARSFGLFAALGVATHLARWRYGRMAGLLWAVAITVLIGVSESRLALGVAVVLFPISQIPARRLIAWIKVLAVTGVVAVCSYYAFYYFDGLRDRFLKGDVSMRIGTFEINASGRTAFWHATLESFDEAPILGKGAGSAEGLIESVFGTIRHPHNDYLRIAHDYGLIGVCAWIVAISTLLVSIWLAWRRADREHQEDARLQLAALLALIAFALEMTAENTMVNVFVTAPLGLIVGSAFGVRRARRSAAAQLVSLGYRPMRAAHAGTVGK